MFCFKTSDAPLGGLIWHMAKVGFFVLNFHSHLKSGIQQG